MNELGRHYAKQNKPERETNFASYHSYMESKKYNKLVNITKMKTQRYRKQMSDYEWWGRVNVGVEVRGTNSYE